MSVNLSRTNRVIVGVMIVGVVFSTLAWSGGHHAAPAAQPGRDTTPSHQPGPDRKAAKPRHKTAEGRVARELDLRIDEEQPEFLVDIDGPDDMDLHLDLEDLKGLNARIEADVLKNMDVRKALKEDPQDLDALEELDRLAICDEDLEELKDLNIDEDIWNELQELKTEMDGLREEIDNEVSGKVDDDRVREAVRHVVEAVKMEIPRVRREVEKAMAAYRDRDYRKWQ
ncbi:MAG: hypothetical protein J0H74_03765 [Chitinophagaceae bacterium]|nr:hypothetical protein [Chitinophagaceae bacterium]